MDIDDIDKKHAAFMRLFLACEPSVYAFIRSAVFSLTDADDILQEVSMVLWKKFDGYEKGTRFDSWAMEVTRLQILRFRQKKGRDRLVFGEKLLDRLAADNDRVGIQEKREALRRCIAKLDSDDREMLAARYKKGETGRSVAQLTGKSESAVSRALSRIQTNLLMCMRKRMQEAG